MVFFSKKVNISILVFSSFILIYFLYVIFYQANSKNNYLQTVAVTKGNIGIHVLSTGLVQPKNRLEIKPPIAGRIEDVLIKEGDIVKKGDLLAWMSSSERAALLDAARAKGLEELKHWEKYYKATPILSPIEGTVILRNVEPGQTFSNQDAIFVLSDELSVKANVDETDLGLIKKGQSAQITLDAYPSKSFQGIVDHIAYEATTVSNVTTYEVDINPISPPDFIRSGMTSNVIFLVEDKRDILIAPTSAIKYAENKTFVELIDGVEKPVILGISDGKNVEIIEGLKVGDLIVIPSLSNDQKSGRNPFRPSRNKKK